MAEVTEENSGGQNIPSGETQENLSNALNALAGLNSNNSALQELAELRQKQAEEAAKNQPPANEEKPPVTNEVIETTENKEVVVPAAEENKEQKENDLFVESALFGGKKTVGKSNETAEPNKEKATFEKIEDFSSYLKEEFKIEDINDVPERLKQLSEKENEINKLTDQLGNVESLFKNMDPKLYNAINAYVNGQPWEEMLNTNAIDYSKDASAFSKKQLVEAMSPGKLSNDDWEEFESEDGDPNVKRFVQSVIDSSTLAFNSKKETITREANERVLKAKEHEQRFMASINASKQNLKTHFQDADDSLMSDIEKAFTSPNGVAGLFYNNDGTLKEDAFVRFAMAEHGANLIDQYQKIAERRIETKINEEILTRGAETPSATKGSGANAQSDEIRPEVQKVLDSIKGIGKSTHY